MQNNSLPTLDFAEILDDAILTVDELARVCGVTSEWVYQHVQEGIIKVDDTRGEWRFDSFSLTRARRVIHLETTFDADPQLAALTADLIDEVLHLRRILNQTAK